MLHLLSDMVVFRVTHLIIRVPRATCGINTYFLVENRGWQSLIWHLAHRLSWSMHKFAYTKLKIHELVNRQICLWRGSMNQSINQSMNWPRWGRRHWGFFYPGIDSKWRWRRWWRSEPEKRWRWRTPRETWCMARAGRAPDQRRRDVKALWSKIENTE